MKIKYKEWTCLVCPKIAQIIEDDAVKTTPYWFTVRTERCMFSSERPSINSTVCSTECLEKAGEVIRESIRKHNFSIPNKKDIEATICDQCGKVILIDSLNQICGPSPLWGWISKEMPGKKLNFCCVECEKNNILKPEESVFFKVEIVTVFDKQRLLKAIDSQNFREAIRVPKFP